ncbi:MAG: ArsR/SmtB family transcription factor [Thermoanaerobaculia bacterium]
METALAALGTPRRREILRLVWSDELPAAAIHEALPDVTFGAVSQHLRVLRDAGLVSCRPDGRRRLYRARRRALGPMRGPLESHWADALYRLKVLAELEKARRGPRAGVRPPRRAR